MKNIIAYFDKPLLKVSMVFSVITGFAAFLFFLGLYFVGIPPLGSVRSLDMGIYVILIAGACLYYRKKYGHGFLHLWEALTIGYFITCVAAIINGWLIYLFVTYIDAGIFNEYITNALDVLQAGRKTQTAYMKDDEFNNLYQTIKSNKPSILISNEISQRLLMAIIPILVISLIFRKQDYGVFQDKS